MLTTKPTTEMLLEWKHLHKIYRPLLSPNRKSGVQVDAHFREYYPHTAIDSEELREMIAAEIYDELFVYRGLDENDLENAFLTAEYVRLVHEKSGG